MIGKGLSPHGRGKLGLVRQQRHRNGSIPARAGETYEFLKLIKFNRVYPRTGGGNRPVGKTPRLIHGLSPHGRGKPAGAEYGASGGGSIPARAGETANHPIP